MNKNLYDTLANKWLNSGLGTVWIYSDPHFGDLETYKLRFVTNTKFINNKKYYQTDENIWEDEESLKCSAYEFDERQIKNINSKCGKLDTLIILGDVGDIECVKKLKARYKILIMGNHDKGASNYKRTYPYIERYQNDESVYGTDNHLFDEVYEGPLMVNDRLILSHEPIEGLPKYMFNIHGHDHSNKCKSDNSMNVCAEHIHFTPVNLLSLLKDGLLKNVLSIHRTTINHANKRKAKKKIR